MNVIYCRQIKRSKGEREKEEIIKYEIHTRKKILEQTLIFFFFTFLPKTHTHTKKKIYSNTISNNKVLLLIA